MTDAKTGDTVRIHYIGTLEDGTTFDSSEGRDPLEFTVGSGQIIPGLDAAIPGMTVGEEKTVTIPPENAYGHPNPEARQRVPREGIPADIPLDPGERADGLRGTLWRAGPWFACGRFQTEFRGGREALP